jgi:hypothetical protein
VVMTFLAVLNLLFLVFIIMQAMAFFGGEAYLQAQGISYASYAREGFFQLLAVAGIVFAIMLAVYRHTHLQQWGSRLLSIALIVETGVVIASALRRLLLYIDAYGLTVSRFWAMTVIVIIAAVLFVFMIGAFMKIKYEPMIKTVFMSSLVVLPLFFLFNVNGYIVRFNFDRFVSGKTDRLDTKYFSDWGISSDAVPEIVAALRVDWPESPKVNGFDKVNLYGALNRKMEELQKLVAADWRNAVISDYRALASLAAIKDIDPAAFVPERSVGNVDAPNYVRISGNGGYAFPKEINGYLSTSTSVMKDTLFFPRRVTGNVMVNMSNYIDKGTLNLPIDSIGGSLIVRDGSIAAFEAMPKHIGGDLDLSHVEVKAPLPVGLDIGGAIAVPQYEGQTSNGLAKDAYAKGYRVRYVPVPAPLDKSTLIPPCGSEENPCQ